MKNCRYCSKEISDDAKFCRNCGRSQVPLDLIDLSNYRPIPEPRNRKNNWVWVFVAIIVCYLLWLALNASGFHITFWALLGTGASFIVGAIIMVGLIRVGVPPIVVRLLFWPILCVLGVFVFVVFIMPGTYAGENTTTIPSQSTPWNPSSAYRPTQKTVYNLTQNTIYRPITWMEVVSFLSADPTNLNANNKYNPDYYTCMDFSIDMVENASKQKIKAWIVGVDFYNQENGHAFVAFETTDLGVVYIEPQKDFRYVNPIVGKPLCDAVYGTTCMGTISSI